MTIDRSEVKERVGERAEKVEERLDHIPRSYNMPDLEQMTIGTAKKFRLGVVFLDIAGFTSYASRNHDEDVLFMLNLFIPELMEIARTEDGFFEKNTGDGILVYFGANDDDKTISKTVIEYIADVKLSLANYVNPTLSEYGVEPVTIKAGASMGPIYISRIGVHSLNRRTAVGTTANEASKLEDKANSNQYFVNQGIYKNADSSWQDLMTDMGPHENYTWGNDYSGRVASHYYNLRGGWTGTKWDNLK